MPAVIGVGLSLRFHHYLNGTKDSDFINLLPLHTSLFLLSFLVLLAGSLLGPSLPQPAEPTASLHTPLWLQISSGPTPSISAGLSPSPASLLPPQPRAMGQSVTLPCPGAATPDPGHLFVLHSAFQGRPFSSLPEQSTWAAPRGSS